MIEHTRYEVDLTIRGFKMKTYVAIPKYLYYLSDETVHEWIKNEVFNYIKENTKFTYQQKLF